MKNGVMRYVLVFSLVFIAGCAQMAWEKTSEANTLSGYQEFIEQYPDSEYVPIAKDRVEELCWKQVQAKDSIQAYEKYVKEYSKGKYKSAAQARIEELVWEDVQDSNTIDSYRSYLNKYPVGQHVTDAKENIETLAFNAAKNEDTLEAYTKFISDYPLCSHVQEAQQLAELIRRQERFFDRLSSFDEASKMRSYLCSEEAKSFVTEVNISKIEQIIAKHTFLLDSKALPAMVAKKDGKKGSGTLKQVGSPLFGTPLTTSTYSGVVGGGSVDGEIGIFYEGRRLLIRTEFPNDLIPTIPGPELFAGMRTSEPVMPLAEKSIHRFDGTVILGGYKLINKGNPLNRLTFLLTENGYIYLRGEGTVLTPAGDKVNFPPADENL